MSRRITYILIILSTYLIACVDNRNTIEYYNPKAMQEKLHEQLNKIKTFDSTRLQHNITTPIEVQVAETYFLNDYNLVWAQKNNYHPSLKEFTIQIANLQDEGVNFKDIKLGRVEYIVNTILGQYENKYEFNLDSIIQYDIELTNIYLTLAKQILMGQDKNIISDINDTLFSGGEYLALAINKSQNFPSFDGFRPENPLYSKLILANKNWMVLQNDQEYMDAKEAFINGNQTEFNIQTIINKELHLSNKKLDFKNLLIIFQHYRNLNKTGTLDAETIQLLSRKPEIYKEKIRQNLEKLRFLRSQKEEQFIIINSHNNIYKYYHNGILISKGDVDISKTDSNHIYETALENIISNPIYSNYVNISAIKLRDGNQSEEITDDLIFVDPRNNAIINKLSVNSDSLTKYLIFKTSNNITSTGYENKNSGKSKNIAINTWPISSDNDLTITFIDDIQLIKAIQKHSLSLKTINHYSPTGNYIFSKAVPIYILNLNFVSDIDTGEVIYLN